MSAEVVPFSFEGEQVRTVLDADGQPWFVAPDAARLLGYRDAHNMTRRLDADDRGTRLVSTPGGHQMLGVITEAGFYAAIFGSQVDGAKRVKGWLAHDVLPALRRTGTYSVTPSASTAVLVKPTARQLAQLVLEESDRADAEAAGRVAAEAAVAVLAPKAELAETYLSAVHGERKVGDAAKLFGIPEWQLRAFLVDQHLAKTVERPCHTRSNASLEWRFNARHADFFKYRDVLIDHRSRKRCVHMTLVIRPAGMAMLNRRLARAGLLEREG